MDAPYERTVFAHLLALDCACPGCGAVYAGPARTIREGLQRSAARKGKPWAITKGYDATTGRFTCPRCEKTWVLGVVFWPVVSGPGRRVRPGDTIPSIPQALALREAASRSALRPRKGVREAVNRVEVAGLEAPDVTLPAAKDDPLIE